MKKEYVPEPESVVMELPFFERMKENIKLIGFWVAVISSCWIALAGAMLIVLNGHRMPWIWAPLLCVYICALGYLVEWIKYRLYGGFYRELIKQKKKSNQSSNTPSDR